MDCRMPEIAAQRCTIAAMAVALAFISGAAQAQAQTPVDETHSVHAEAPREAAKPAKVEDTTALSGVTVSAAPTPQVSGVVVMPRAKEPPAVVSTYPAAGDAVKPGALILKITFDQRMSPSDWKFDRADDRYPSCLARPRLLSDERTFVLLCTVGGAGKFAIQINGPGEGGFRNQANQRATPLLLQFTTLDGASLSTIKEAMKSAGLKDEDDPVMDYKPQVRQASAGDAPPAQ